MNFSGYDQQEDIKMREKIRHVPIPLSGVMLGFAALGNYLKSSSAVSG